MQKILTGLPVGRPHSFLVGLIALWVFSAAVSAMSPPGESSRGAYRWLFRFCHLLAANLDRAGFFGEGPAMLSHSEQPQQRS